MRNIELIKALLPAFQALTIIGLIYGVYLRATTTGNENLKNRSLMCSSLAMLLLTIISTVVDNYTILRAELLVILLVSAILVCISAILILLTTYKKPEVLTKITFPVSMVSLIISWILIIKVR